MGTIRISLQIFEKNRNTNLRREGKEEELSLQEVLGKLEEERESIQIATITSEKADDAVALAAS